MGQVDNRICIITGGAMGLGRADAEVLAREGAQVMITDIDEAAGSRTAEELGPNVHFMRHDVTSEQRWIEVIDEVIRRFGRLDILVNNAGIVSAGDIETLAEGDWRRINAVSADATFFGCKHAIRAMRAFTAPVGGRSIINMASIAALRGFAAIPAYTAAKGAIRALTKSVAAHCLEQGLGIRCNVVLPGNMDTPMMRSFVGDDVGALKHGSAYDVANTVLFLASDASRFITGAEFVIDDGATMMAPA